LFQKNKQATVPTTPKPKSPPKKKNKQATVDELSPATQDFLKRAQLEELKPPPQIPDDKFTSRASATLKGQGGADILSKVAYLAQAEQAASHGGVQLASDNSDDDGEDDEEDDDSPETHESIKLASSSEEEEDVDVNEGTQMSCFVQ